LTTTITELAKDLILAGLNIEIYDKNLYKGINLITEEETYHNFFLSKNEIGKEVNFILNYNYFLLKFLEEQGYRTKIKKYK
jgi:hypothetical protein